MQLVLSLATICKQRQSALVLKSTYSTTYNVVPHNYSLFLPFFSAETNDFLTDFLTLSLKMKFCLNKSCRSAASFFDKQAKEAVVEKHTNLPVPPSCAINAQKKSQPDWLHLLFFSLWLSLLNRGVHYRIFNMNPK